MKHKIISPKIVAFFHKHEGKGFGSLWKSLGKKLFKQCARATSEMPNVDPKVEYLIHYGEDKAQSHYKLWDPVFAERPGTYASVFRRFLPWWPVRDQPHVYPVATIAQVGPLLERFPNIKAIFYPASNGLNLQLVRNNQYTHVFIGHGDSNKASSANKALRVYDELWVAGQAHLDRFKDVEGNYSGIDFRVIGQPWMKDWLNELPKYEAAQRVSWAYLPTWRGYHADTQYSSLDKFGKIASAVSGCLPDQHCGYVKMHPWSTPADVAQVKAVDRVRDLPQVGADQPLPAPTDGSVWFVEPTEQLRVVLKMPLRFVVCDVSAAVTECLYVNVPIFLYRPKDGATHAANFEAQHDFCYIFSNVKEFEDCLRRVIGEGDDYLSSQRENALGRFVDIDRTKAGQFYDELARLSD